MSSTILNAISVQSAHEYIARDAASNVQLLIASHEVLRLRDISLDKYNTCNHSKEN